MIPEGACPSPGAGFSEELFSGMDDAGLGAVMLERKPPSISPFMSAWLGLAWMFSWCITVQILSTCAEPAVLPAVPVTCPGGRGLPASPSGIPLKPLWHLEYPQKGCGEGDCFSYSLRWLSHASMSSSLKNHSESQDQTNKSLAQRLKPE